MPKKRLIIKLFLPLLVLILVSTLLLVWLANRSAGKLYLQQIETDLTSWANLAAFLGAGLDSATGALDSLAQSLDNISGARFTFIDENGRVLGDSRKASASMENHLERPEVRAALQGSTGIAVRQSPSLGQTMMYHARPRAPADSFDFIVRTALPVSEIQTSLNNVFLQIEFGWAAVFLVAVLLTYFIASRQLRPLKEMQSIAGKFASGDLEDRIPIPDTHELANLSKALNNMAGQLRERMEAIRRERNELEAILASMNEGVVAVDNDDRILLINRTAERLLSANASEVVQRELHEVIRIADLVDFIKELRMSNVEIEREIYLNNRQVVLNARGTSIMGSGEKPIGRVIVLTDVTRIRHLETVRRDFVANVSHELRTPITSIKGSAETLLEGGLDDRGSAVKFTDMILRNADRMNLIVENLLSLARLEQGNSNQLVYEYASIRNILLDAVTACKEKAESRKITINIEGEIPEVRCNAQLIEEAVINLLDNAIKYSPEGSVIRMVLKADLQEASITVIDSGSGIEAQHLPRLFERFYRVDPHRSRQEGGTGLGLAIVKHIALVHRGRVSVSSIPGKGSSFGIHLPMS